jgi:hypothetical protein
VSSATDASFCAMATPCVYETLRGGGAPAGGIHSSDLVTATKKLRRKRTEQESGRFVRDTCAGPCDAELRSPCVRTHVDDQRSSAPSRVRDAAPSAKSRASASPHRRGGGVIYRTPPDRTVSPRPQLLRADDLRSRRDRTYWAPATASPGRADAECGEPTRQQLLRGDVLLLSPHEAMLSGASDPVLPSLLIQHHLLDGQT